MKLFLLTAIVALATSARGSDDNDPAVTPGSTTSIRGKGSDDESFSPTEAIRASIEKIEQHRRKLDVGDSAKSDASCDCSKNAKDEILSHQKDVLEHIPTGFLVLMDDNSDAISATLGGVPYNPLDDFEGLVEAIDEIVRKAIVSLDAMHCGPCDDHDDGDNSTEICPGINHYECCCDVEFIKDLAIKEMYGLAEITNLNPGASHFVQISRDAIKRTTMVMIMEKALPYFDCLCPCFSMGQVRYADANSEFDRCQRVQGARKVIDFDVVKETDEDSFAFCVGKNCEKHCIVDPNNGDCLQELIGDQTYCYGGVGYLGRPYPYQWDVPPTIIAPITEAQEEACCQIMEDFCLEKGWPLPPADDDVGTLSVQTFDDDVDG